MSEIIVILDSLPFKAELSPQDVPPADLILLDNESSNVGRKQAWRDDIGTRRIKPLGQCFPKYMPTTETAARPRLLSNRNTTKESHPPGSEMNAATKKVICWMSLPPVKNSRTGCVVAAADTKKKDKKISATTTAATASSRTTSTYVVSLSAT